MRVLKFGGTSLANAEKFIQCRQIILQAQQSGPVAVVLSAPTTVTNTLVGLVKSAQQGQVDQQQLDDLQQRFTQIIQGLLTPPLQQQLLHQLQQQLTHLQQLLSSIAIFAFCPDKIEAEIICLGERLSILLMQSYWQQQQDQVVVIEPQRYLLAKGSYLQANVDIEQSIARFKHHPLPSKPTILLLMAGFMAANEQGELVVLGRNGSDYSAAVLAACLQAECCEIWTDVDGIYTCDPRIVADAKLLKQLSYQEAMELSYFGAKVLHPRTIAPIAQFQIPCLIKNSRHPAGAGTRIHRQTDNSQSQIKGITHLENNVMLNLSGPGMKGMVGMAGRLFTAMSQANISIILISQSSSEYSICFCIAQQQWSQAQRVLENEFRLELQAGLLEPIESIQPVAIISVVGDGMRTQSGVAAKLLGALAHGKINIIAMAQGSSERSISVVVDNQAAKRGIRLIHQRLFSVDRVIEVIVVGCGGVGTALLAQIARQQARLKQKNIDLRVCGISNSRHALYDVNGIDLANWSSRLMQQTTGFSLQQLQQMATNDWLLNPVIVDCTSSQEIANHYVRFFQWGFHVVTPNKKANTGSWQHYQQIQQSARQARRQFLYETTVGAGLPVIENLQNLLNAGDELIQFSGILSGSLSYIFGLLDEGVSFSQATWQATERGYTEPDPRDDLSGMDVARKLLILAREVGLSLELADIEIDAILPAHAVVDGDKEQFMRCLADVDHYFAEKVEQAQQQNKVLRYVGQIKEGKASVNLLAVDSQHPLYKVKNGENALAFYSQYYQPLPLILRGYGAGNEVTAAGIFADILRTAHWQWRQ